MLIAHGMFFGVWSAIIAISAFPNDIRKCALLAIAIGVIVATSILTFDLVRP